MVGWMVAGMRNENHNVPEHVDQTVVYIRYLDGSPTNSCPIGIHAFIWCGSYSNFSALKYLPLVRREPPTEWRPGYWDHTSVTELQ